MSLLSLQPPQPLPPYSSSLLPLPDAPLLVSPQWVVTLMEFVASQVQVKQVMLERQERLARLVTAVMGVKLAKGASEEEMVEAGCSGFRHQHSPEALGVQEVQGALGVFLLSCSDLHPEEELVSGWVF